MKKSTSFLLPHFFHCIRNTQVNWAAICTRFDDDWTTAIRGTGLVRGRESIDAHF